LAENNRDWSDVIKRFPERIMGFIVFVTAVVGFIKLWQGDTGLVTVVLLVVGIGGGLLSCLYLAFKRTPPLVEGSSKGVWRYPRARVWALTGLVLIPILVGGVVCYHLFEEAQPPTKIILLIADLDGPDPKKYRVTETVLARLRTELELYEDVQVVALGWCITEAEGSAAARAEGEKRKAAVVIWGWYGVTAEAVSISVHFDVLRSPKYMPELGLGTKGLAQTMAVAELESFTLQTRLSAEMSYLSLFTVGMACYAAADWDGAIARFSDALSQTEEHVSALNQNAIYCYRAVAYYFKGDYDLAIADYDRAIELRPDYVEAYINRGTTYISKGDYDRAIADFDRAIELRPNGNDAYYNRGSAYCHKGNYDLAIADYDRAIELRPAADTYTNRGLAYDFRGDYDLAIADYDRAIELLPDYAEAYCNRGTTYSSKGDYDRAIADYDQAIHLRPDTAEAYYNRGSVYCDKGDYDRAIADYDRAIELRPAAADAYYSRGLAYGSTGDYNRAIADYDRAIELRPDDAEAYNNRANAYNCKGDYDRAIADCGQAIELRPDCAEAYYNRAIAYKQRGEKEKAIADFEKFLKLSNDPDWRKQAEQQLQELSEE